MRKSLLALGLATAVFAAPSFAQANIEATMTKALCLTCHAKDKKLVGPSYKDVAAKYKGKADAVAMLSAKVRKGGQGVWGPVPMPPTGADKISDADLKAAIEWVLKQ
ncbi:MAG: c-type cytochrome [Betaproteobacteria bacterium]|nr:c-type cytochrome [Betaproteobacteria bacterium]MCC6248287.1 c-type cytochrome [Rubrivivax sp.]MCL4700054.1 c-type cytochrome [Burkholderiaceae bacterium]